MGGEGLKKGTCGGNKVYWHKTKMEERREAKGNPLVCNKAAHTRGTYSHYLVKLQDPVTPRSAQVRLGLIYIQ